MIKPRVGIPHDGGHKKNDWLVDELGPFVTWVPVCPEAEMGLGIPRETPQLDAFVFKKDLPSRSEAGLLVAEMKRRYPVLPMIEEGRLNDRLQREAFAVQLFGFARLRMLPRKISELQKFHQSYKLLLMAQSPTLYVRLGRIAANSERLPAEECFREYRALFLRALKAPNTVQKSVNALQHMFGYFKDKIESREKREILDVIEEYRRGETTLAGPLTLLRRLARKHDVEYLKCQLVFEPFPRNQLLTNSSKGWKSFLSAALSAAMYSLRRSP